jgi:hypothetical protein
MNDAFGVSNEAQEATSIWPDEFCLAPKVRYYGESEWWSRAMPPRLTVVFCLVIQACATAMGAATPKSTAPPKLVTCPTPPGESASWDYAVYVNGRNHSERGKDCVESAVRHLASHTARIQLKL